MPDPSHVLEYQPVELEEDLSYEEQPVQILDRKEQRLRSRSIPVVKVLWRSQTVEEATWEPEEQMRANAQNTPPCFTVHRIGKTLTAVTSGHLSPRDRFRSTRLEAPITTHPISPPETSNPDVSFDWFKPEVSDRCAAASAVCFK
ncbi:unnamed protein product [Prunus armeniaca]